MSIIRGSILPQHYQTGYMSRVIALSTTQQAAAPQTGNKEHILRLEPLWWSSRGISIYSLKWLNDALNSKGKMSHINIATHGLIPTAPATQTQLAQLALEPICASEFVHPCVSHTAGKLYAGIDFDKSKIDSLSCPPPPPPPPLVQFINCWRPH